MNPITARGGHRVLIECELLPTSDNGLRGPLEAGHKSVAYRFVGLDDEQPWVHFGALIENVIQGGKPGGRMTAVISFWYDLAKVYATPGVTIDLWYGRLVGSGTIIEICDDQP